jgi:hypothetical protein
MFKTDSNYQLTILQHTKISVTVHNTNIWPTYSATNSTSFQLHLSKYSLHSGRTLSNCHC